MSFIEDGYPEYAELIEKEFEDDKLNLKVKPGYLNKLAAKINANAAAHGFWDTERNFAEMLFLIISEAAEAGEEHRAGNPDYYEHMVDRGNGVRVAKPEGVSVELVDVLIRTLDTLHSRGVDIDWTMEQKMAFNAGREYKHGKAY